MPARHQHRHHLRCRLASVLAASYVMMLASTASAARNITIAASDTSIIYSPNNAWQSRNGQSANVGDGTARIATQNGATASLTFTGTAIYFQTVRSSNHGVATINLDGADFKIDSSNSGGSQSTGDTGVVWGIGELRLAAIGCLVCRTLLIPTQLSVLILNQSR